MTQVTQDQRSDLETHVSLSAAVFRDTRLSTFAKGLYGVLCVGLVDKLSEGTQLIDLTEIALAQGVAPHELAEGLVELTVHGYVRHAAERDEQQ